MTSRLHGGAAAERILQRRLCATTRLRHVRINHHVRGSELHGAGCMELSVGSRGGGRRALLAGRTLLSYFVYCTYLPRSANKQITQKIRNTAAPGGPAVLVDSLLRAVFSFEHALARETQRIAPFRPLITAPAHDDAPHAPWDRCADHRSEDGSQAAGQVRQGRERDVGRS